MKDSHLNSNTFLNQFKNQEEFSSFISETYKSGIEQKLNEKFDEFCFNHPIVRITSTEDLPK